MPNIPQMASVWSDLGAAWVRSTKGPGAIAAKRSFIGAQKSISRRSASDDRLAREGAERSAPRPLVVPPSLRF